MKRILLVAALMLGLALPAAADTIDVLRQNTLTLVAQDGRTTTVLIGEGQRLQQVNGAGMQAEGIWRLEADRGFCWTARGEATLCISLPADAAVGATWDVKGPTGFVAWKAEIVAGRADLRALSGADGSPADH